MKTKHKKDLKSAIANADAAKKVNPLDLSSDQDLTIALMNLIAIEDEYYVTGAKNGLGQMVHDIRARLMARIVPASRMDLSVRLLGRAMHMIDDGIRVLADDNQVAAYAMFDGAYELYSLFWGLNMGLVSENEILKSNVEI